MNKSHSSRLILSLHEELEATLAFDIDLIAVQIKDIGFECMRCGKCCRENFGDNRVLLDSEDLCILGRMSLRDEFVIPMTELSAGNIDDCQLVDENGGLHTFGWMLRRKSNMDCVFLEEESRCRVYESRPHLCRTYPFFLHEGRLEVCECEGIGYPISTEAAVNLASDMVHRKITELNDTIRVYEKFLEASFSLEEKDGFSLEDVGSIVVHDTEGFSYFDPSGF